MTTSFVSLNFESMIKQSRVAGRAMMLFILLLVAAATLKAQTFGPDQQIMVPGSAGTQARGINAFGQIVGSWIDANGGLHGFVYNAGTYTNIDVSHSTQTVAYAINNAGDIVGTFNEDSSGIEITHGFLLSKGVLTEISAPGLDINNFGFIATAVGFITTSGEVIPISDPGAQIISFLGINDAFQMVGTFAFSHGFLYSNPNFTNIDVPNQANATPSGINTLGQIVGGYAAGNVGGLHGFLRDSQGAYTQIDFSNGFSTFASRINDFEEIVGWASIPEGVALSQRVGFLRSPVRNPIPHISQALVPNTAAPGSGGLTLTINGTGFVQGSLVEWNGSALPTTFGSGKQLTATVSAADVAAAGTASVTVVNAGPGGGVSNTEVFQITSPVVSPTFKQSTLPGGASPQAIIAADFNGDGIIDLAAADGPNNGVVVALGNGDGTFGPPASFHTGNNPSNLIAGDFDGDGKLDIAVANSGDGGIALLQGNGDGTFHLDPIVSVVGSAPLGLAVGDFNGDGRLDLAVVNTNDNTVSILLGNGDPIFNGEGAFQPRQDFPTNPGPNQMTVGDFNGDGILDFAVANFGGFNGNTVSVFLGNGNGTFKPKVDYSVNLAPLSLVAADFNGDGKLDLAVNDSCADSTPCGRPGAVSILLGNGDGTFQNHVDYPAGSFPYSIVAGDFNGDGKLDAAVSDLDSAEVTIMLGAGDGTFLPNTVAIPAAGSPVLLLAADFDGDGHMDLAAGTRSGINVLMQYVPQQTITSFVCDSATVVSGNSVNCTVTLSGPAPAGGATIDFASSNTAGVIPPSPVVIPETATSISISVVSQAVAVNTPVAITAGYGGSTQTANLSVTPATLLSLTLSPKTQVGGKDVVATATLNGLAPSSGLTVTVVTSDPSVALVQGDITIAGSTLSGTSTIRTFGVDSKMQLKVLATLAGISRGTVLTITPASLLSVTVNPNSVYGMTSSPSATVALNGQAGPSGATITLASSDPNTANLASSVTIMPQQTSSPAVTISTQAVSANTQVTISATYGIVTRNAKLTVKAPVLLTITLNPAVVLGGRPSFATVYLSSPAPTGGIVVALASSNTSLATVQSIVPISAGKTSSDLVPVLTSPVFLPKSVRIIANYAGVAKAATLGIQ